MSNTTDINKACKVKRNSLNKSDGDVKLESIIRICIDVPHDITIGEAKKAIQTLIRTEKLKLLAELGKSMPTAEQLTTKYGYHMPEKQYGYKLALHDIGEVLAEMEAEL